MRDLAGGNSESFAYYVLNGNKVTNPEYKQQILSEYAGNPLIEALPAIFSRDQVIRSQIHYPEVPEDIEQQAPEIRFQMLQRIKDFYLPPVEFVDIERQFSALIRKGYIARNPIKDNVSIKVLQEINDVKRISDQEKIARLAQVQAPNRTTASSFSVIGVSGIGKTTAIERILMMYPQVIYHSEYKNKPFTRIQLVWLKVDCPYDGSLKTLCRSFFSAVDNVLGTTNYFQKYGNPKNSTALMMVHMAYISALHSIGVIIIDEIQHLLASKVNSEEMLNFFVTLVNTIGVPLFYIGTYKAMKVLNQDFRQARRIGTEGVLMWDRMKNDRKWMMFLQTIWEFQYLSEYTELTDDLANAMYELSQGITSVAVSLFTLAQKKAIGREECLTKELLKKVYDNDLAMIKPMLNALKNNNIRDLSKYEDLVINIDELMSRVEPENNVEDIIAALAAEKHHQTKENGKSDFIDKTEKQKANNYSKRDLRKIYHTAIKAKQDIYDAINAAGYIKNPLKELNI